MRKDKILRRVKGFVNGEEINIPADNNLFMWTFEEIQDLINDLEVFLELADNEAIKEYNTELGKDLFGEQNNYNKTLKELECRKQDKEIKKSEGYVYLFNIDKTNTYKIGITNDIEIRKKQIGLKMPYELIFLHSIKSDYTKEVEKELHKKFKKQRINGEWFELSLSDVDFIKEYKGQVKL